MKSRGWTSKADLLLDYTIFYISTLKCFKNIKNKFKIKNKQYYYGDLSRWFYAPGMRADSWHQILKGAAANRRGLHSF